MEHVGTIVVIVISIVVLFVGPVMTMADKTDDAVNLTVQSATTEFVNKIKKTGKLTQDDYDNFILTLSATGNTYDVEIILQILDENPAKKSNGARQVIGDNVYYSKYTSQVLDELRSGVISLKEGDIVIVRVKNSNRTPAAEFRNGAYKVTGNDSSTIKAEDSGVVGKTAD